MTLVARVRGSRLDFMRSSAVAIISIFVVNTSPTLAGIIEASSIRINALEPLSETEKRERFRIAELYAPIIFQEEWVEDIRAQSGFNPIDQATNLDFEDDSDYSNNSQRIFRLTTQQEEALLIDPSLYFSVMETATHTYLHYMIYRAVDWGPHPHSHDTENIWMIIPKKSREIEAVLTNAHGLAMLYSPNEKTQRLWREEIPSDSRRKFLKAIDPVGIKHHENGDFELLRESGRQHPMIYSCARTHALYKLNQKLSASAHGTFYIPRLCGNCDALEAKSIRPYRLIDFDAWMLQKLDDFALRKVSLEVWSRMFLVEQDISSQGVKRFKLPEDPAPDLMEESSSASFFYASDMNFPIDLMDPARKHLILDPFNREISVTYLRHAYRVPEPAQTQRFHMSLWDLFRMTPHLTP